MKAIFFFLLLFLPACESFSSSRVLELTNKIQAIEAEGAKALADYKAGTLPAEQLMALMEKSNAELLILKADLLANKGQGWESWVSKVLEIAMAVGLAFVGVRLHRGPPEAVRVAMGVSRTTRAIPPVG